MDNKNNILQNFVRKIIIKYLTILKDIKHQHSFKYAKHYLGTLDAGALSILWEPIYLGPVLICGKNIISHAEAFTVF